MKKFLIAGIIGAVVMFVVEGFLANVVYVPLFSEEFGALMRGADNAIGGFPFFIVGFLMFGFIMAFIYANIEWNVSWLKKTLSAGLLFWGLMFADYLIVVGWSTMPERAMSLSGLISGLAPFVGCFAIGLVYRKDHQQ